jgi:hypothetical protein
MPKHEPTSAEYQQVLNENDALRAAIVKLTDKLENCEMIRQEQDSYIRGLWEDNRRVHAELRFHNRQEKPNARWKAARLTPLPICFPSGSCQCRAQQSQRLVYQRHVFEHHRSHTRTVLGDILQPCRCKKPSTAANTR